MVLYLCVGLTSLSIGNHPLRDSDNEFYQKDKNRLVDICSNNVESRRVCQRRYSKKRHRAMNIQVRALNESDVETENPRR